MGTHGNQMKTTLTRILRFTPSRLLLAGLIFATPLMARAKDPDCLRHGSGGHRLLASLDAGLKSNAAYSFENETRDVWHFFPTGPSVPGFP